MFTHSSIRLLLQVKHFLTYVFPFLCRKEEEFKKALEDQLLEVKEREEEAAELEKKEYELIKEKIALEDAVRARPRTIVRERVCGTTVLQRMKSLQCACWAHH